MSFRRRIVTVPTVLLAFTLTCALFPLLLVLALFIDLVRAAKSMSTTRLTLFLLAFLCTETLGLGLLFFTFLSTRSGTRARAQRTFAIQRLYTGLHLRAVTRIFSIRFVVEGSELVLPGPLVVFVRHASLVDVLIPGGFIANAHLVELRYVLKKELLAEPCLDIAGHWIPNHFVDRRGIDTPRELDAIRALATGLSAREGVILYPEGTRFSRRRRQSVIDALEGEARTEAESLKHLLPIKRGGALSVLGAAQGVDVLFVGHHGLEGLTRLGDIWRGSLVGAKVTVKFWRERAADVPVEPDAQVTWLKEKWARMDSWLEQFE